MADYDKAIELQADYAEAFDNRAAAEVNAEVGLKIAQFRVTPVAPPAHAPFEPTLPRLGEIDVFRKAEP